MSWTLNHAQGRQGDQQSFIGGKPRLPLSYDVPSCSLCGEKLTFFFQIAIPKGEAWEGNTVAVFACTKCVDENHLIPAMLNTPLQGAAIPEGFLRQYQHNFSFLVFPTDQGLLLQEYSELIRFAEIQIQEGDGIGSFGKLGGEPVWVLQDESPSTYGNVAVGMTFLLQVVPNFEYSTISGAAPQLELDITGRPAPSPLNYYQLFIGNALYVFGTRDENHLVYAITQV